MRAHGVIFDLDGTLLDSLADIGESMNAVLAEMRMPLHGLAEYRGFVGDGVSMLVRRALPPADRHDSIIAGAVARMREVYRGRIAQKTRPYDGIPQLLDRLEERGLAKAVLSNKPHDLTVSLVSSLLGRWSFDPVFGERAGVAKKPDPAAALEIAERWSVAPAGILYVGDTPIDIATARAAGMPVVAASWGFRDESELVAAGAAAIARRPLDVLEHLL